MTYQDHESGIPRSAYAAAAAAAEREARLDRDAHAHGGAACRCFCGCTNLRTIAESGRADGRCGQCARGSHAV